MHIPRTKPHPDHWHEDQSIVIELANHLVDECWLTTPEEVVKYFEKPWKWTSEYHQYMSFGVVEEIHND